MRIKFRGLTYFAVLVLTLLILYFGLRGTNSSISNVKQPTKNRNIFTYARTHILHTITKICSAPNHFHILLATFDIIILQVLGFVDAVELNSLSRSFLVKEWLISRLIILCGQLVVSIYVCVYTVQCHSQISAESLLFACIHVVKRF